MPISLTIMMNDKGQVSVQGPLHDKILCFGLLEVAKTVIVNIKAEEKPQIVAPNIGMRFPIKDDA